jgi:hypothetical protein
MRWDNLFDDLESQLEHELTADDIDVRAEEERLRLARMSLRERLVSIHEHSSDATASAGTRVRLANGGVVTVRPLAFGRDWFSAALVDGASRHSQCIVPLAAVAGLLLDREQVRASLVASPDRERSLSVRLGLAFALRDLCRRRTAVELHLLGETVQGTIDRVGRDHLDLAVHEPGSPRREAEVSHYRVVPFSQVLLVRL